MNLKYKIQKAWFSVWQKYKLEVHLKIAGRLFMTFLAVWIIGSVLTIMSQWAFVDKFKGGTPFQFKYLEYFWSVIIELISGFDVQNKQVLHFVSKIISVIILITGVILLAIFTGQVVSMFVQVLQQSRNLPEKPDKFKFDHPIIICGINDKLDRIVKELKRSSLSQNREIIIVDEDADKIKVEDKKIFKDVWYTKGNQADRAIIEKVLGEKDSTAIILSKEPNCNRSKRYSDARVIETALAIEGYSEKTHTVVELNNEENIPHLEHTKINEYISIADYSIKLTSQTAMQHGMADVYLYLLGGTSKNKKTNQIYFSSSCLPGTIAGKTYEEIRDDILADSSMDITLIGFAKYVDNETNETLQLNLTNTCYIKQLNPISRTCRLCAGETFPIDQLGRVAHNCPDCAGKANKETSNQLYFPKDTVIKKEDQLIYLSNQEIDFHSACP